MTIKDIESQIGSLSNPSKMPCHGYSIPAVHCLQGSKLRKVTNSTCSKCYALKGRYVFENVKNAMEKRYQSLSLPNWVDLMVEIISRKEKSEYFRWHDSGDIQSVNHLQNICEIAKRLPQISFWIPTREVKILKQFFSQGYSIPENLTVRVSSFFIDSEFKKKPFGLVTSSVTTDPNKITCPSSKQNNQCLDCRACWDKNVDNVTYGKH